MEEKDPHTFSHSFRFERTPVTGLDYEGHSFDSDDRRDKEITEFVKRTEQHRALDVMLSLLCTRSARASRSLRSCGV